MIDGVFVINLDHRTDRWEEFQVATRNVIPAEKLRRLSGCLGRELPGFGRRPWFGGGKRDKTWAGRAGCLISHRRALLEARARGWHTVLLLEDDAKFSPAFGDVAAALSATLQEQDWQICYLGFTEPWWPVRQLAELGAGAALHQVHGCTTTHAYIVREAARDWILEHLPDETNVWLWLATHRAIDRWYQRRLGLKFQVVCVSPSIVNQSDSESDIVVGANAATVHSIVAPNTSKWSRGVYHIACVYRRIAVGFGRGWDHLRGLARRWSGF